MPAVPRRVVPAAVADPENGRREPPRGFEREPREALPWEGDGGPGERELGIGGEQDDVLEAAPRGVARQVGGFAGDGGDAGERGEGRAGLEDRVAALFGFLGGRGEALPVDEAARRDDAA